MCNLKESRPSHRNIKAQGKKENCLGMKFNYLIIHVIVWKYLVVNIYFLKSLQLSSRNSSTLRKRKKKENLNTADFMEYHCHLVATCGNSWTWLQGWKSQRQSWIWRVKSDFVSYCRQEPPQECISRSSPTLCVIKWMLILEAINSSL